MTTSTMSRLRRLAPLAAVLLGVFVAGHGPVSAQANRPQATFRSDINYVEVDVVVTDAQGRFVPGLTPKDFELVDAGKPQSIEVFHEINVPVQRADRPLFSQTAIVPDVASNEQTAEGRVYVLLLDDLHTKPVNTVHVKARAREFVERYIGSNDLGAVVHTSGRRDVAQEFTSDQSLLMSAIDGFQGRGLPSNLQNRMDDFQLRRGTPAFQAVALDYAAKERLAIARGTFTAVRNVAGYLSSLSGRRKALLLFSEGMDLDIETALTLDSASATLGHIQDARNELIEAISVATRANVHVYAIDAAGMSTGVVGAETGAVPFGDNAEAQGLKTEGYTNERRRVQGTLRTIADETGGIPIVNTNNFADGFSRIQQENSTYYLLGFYPSTDRDGKFHKLAVRTSRPGLQVRARAGYFAPKGSSTRARASSDPFADMMRAAVPTAGLPMRLSVPVFKGNGTDTLAVMAIDVQKEVFRFEPGAAGWSEDLELVYQLIDTQANVVASESQKVELRLQPDARDLVEERGFRVLVPIKVRPGRYQVRVAARTTNSAMRGSLFGDVIVPDFFRTPLVWSGVSLTSAGALGVPTRLPDIAVPSHILVMPAAQRVFAGDDTLVLFAEAYDNDTSPHMVDLTTLVRDTTGKVVLSTVDERPSSEGRAYGIRAEIPLSQLPPGKYVLTLTARSRASGNATASRDILFTIS